MIVDNYGNFVFAYIDGNNGSFASPPLILVYSNDRGQNWTNVPQTGVQADTNRPSLAYDSVNDKIHMVYQGSDTGVTTGLWYRRYTITRDGSNNITGFTSDGAVALDSTNSRRPTLLWTTDGGANGTLVVSWYRQRDDGAQHLILASSRVLTNDANDFTAANWTAPDGVNDDLSAYLSAQPNANRDLITQESGGSLQELGLSCIVQRNLSSGTHNKDLYIIYALRGATLNGVAWKKADWDSTNNDNWSGGWSSETTFVTSAYSLGSANKDLTMSCVYDNVNDYVWVSAARWSGTADTITLYGINSSDANFTAGDVYTVSEGGGTASRLLMTALAFDGVTNPAEVWIAYITGDTTSADGYVRYRTYRLGTGFAGSGDLYAVSGQPHNYPNLLMYRHQDLLLGLARRTLADNYTVRVLRTSITSNPDKPTGLSATAGDGQVSLSWTAPNYNGGSALTDYVIQYREGSSGDFTTLPDGTSTTTSTNVTGLTNGTSYEFQVAAVNANGNSYFTSLVSASPVDTTSPTVSSVSVSPSTTSAVVTWTTNEAASSIVDFGMTNAYGSSTSETDTSPRVTSHSVTVSNLLACTRYHYRVRSKDAATNQGTSSDGTFNTTGCTGSSSFTNLASSAITTSSGGSLSLTNDTAGSVALTVPAAFSGSNATFQAKQLDKTSVITAAGSPSGFSAIGSHVYDFKAYQDATTSITSFNNPITITITYADADVTGYDTSTLKIYRYASSTWNQLSGCTVDTTAKTVSCTTTGFSTFALFGQTASSSSSSSSPVSNLLGSTTLVPTCAQITGPRAPWLYGAIPQTATSVLLYFTGADLPYDRYYISYSEKPNTYEHGVEFIATSTNRTFLINHLKSNTTYYFRIRSGNGCATGAWSNELSAQTKSFFSSRVAAAAMPPTEPILTVPTTTPTAAPSLQPESSLPDQTPSVSGITITKTSFVQKILGVIFALFRR